MHHNTSLIHSIHSTDMDTKATGNSRFEPFSQAIQRKLRESSFSKLMCPEIAAKSSCSVSHSSGLRKLNSENHAKDNPYSFEGRASIHSIQSLSNIPYFANNILLHVTSNFILSKWMKQFANGMKLGHPTLREFEIYTCLQCQTLLGLGWTKTLQ